MRSCGGLLSLVAPLNCCEDSATKRDGRMAVVGDQVQVPARKVGETERLGVVTGVVGSLLRVRWSSGEESTVVPSVGSLRVVGKVRQPPGSRTPSRATTAATRKKRS